MQNIVNLYTCDGRALQAAHQYATQGVAKGQTETALKGFGDQSRLT